jgi:hypothetical protein
LQDDEQVVRSIDPRYGTLRKLQWPFIGRSCVWNPCRGNHLGQRSRVSALKGRTYGRKRSDHNTAKSPCEGGAVHICSLIRFLGLTPRAAERVVSRCHLPGWSLRSGYRTPALRPRSVPPRAAHSPPPDQARRCRTCRRASGHRFLRIRLWGVHAARRRYAARSATARRCLRPDAASGSVCRVGENQRDLPSRFIGLRRVSAA